MLNESLFSSTHPRRLLHQPTLLSKVCCTERIFLQPGRSWASPVPMARQGGTMFFQ